jgi:hypothetical protein
MLRLLQAVALARPLLAQGHDWNSGGEPLRQEWLKKFAAAR